MHEKPQSGESGPRQVPLKIVGIYLLVGGLWILISDWVLAAIFTDPQTLTFWQSLKGWLYVLITAGLLYALVTHYFLLIAQANNAVLKSERQYRALIENMSEGLGLFAIIYDGQNRPVDYRIIDVNPALESIIGRSHAELANRRAADIFGEPLYLDTFARVAETREPVTFDAWCAPRGLDLHVAAFAPLPGYCAAIITDITERRRLEEYQREFLRKTIEAATEGKLLIRERDEIMQLAGPAIAIWEIREAGDLPGVRDAVANMAQSAGMDKERVFDFCLGISEAMTNAVKHAGGGTFSLHRPDERWLAIMTDYGPGIPAINLPELALKHGYTTAVSLGMGYKTMISTADHVYLATGPDGTTVGIEMNLHTPEPPPPVFPGLNDNW